MSARSRLTAKRHRPQTAPTPPVEPPNVVDIEEAILGAMMDSDTGCDHALALLAEDDFYRPAHRTVFTAISELSREGLPHNPPAVLARLWHDGTLEDIGGAPFLHSLYSVAVLGPEVPHHAQAMAVAARQRRMMDLGSRLTVAGADPTADHAAIAADFADRLLDAWAVAGGFDDMAEVEHAWSEYLDATTRDAIATWGLIDLDRLTGGLRPGQVIVVAGRPSMGKSSLGIQVARHVAKTHPVAFASYEMSQAEVYAHLLAAEAGVTLHQALTLGALELGPRIFDAVGRLRDLRLRWVNGLPDLDTLIGQLTDAHKRQPLGLVVIDYLQLVPVHRASAQTREQEVAAISRALKLLARRLEVPVLAIAQLNREAATRASRRPVLTDLRESGSLEQDADVVVLVHREDYYDHESPRKGEADLIVAKQRMGPTDTVTVVWNGPAGLFQSMAARAVA